MNRSKEKNPAHDAACRIAATLCNAGFTAYFAGGCVRDRLLGLQPKDYDIATDARPSDIRKLFSNVHDVGVAFGVMLVRLGGHTTEVATFRKEGIYSDSRHPDAIAFADAKTDAQRRDFTINGLFENPATGSIIDYFGGQRDLQSHIIRAIGNPNERFEEDHLRMLRAVRFAARFDFSLDEKTADAIKSRSDQLRGISRERIGQELEWMCQQSSRANAIAMLEELGLDAPMLNEDSKHHGNVFLKTLRDDTSFGECLAAWWLARHRADDCEEKIKHGVRRWRKALVLSNDISQQMRNILLLKLQLGREWPKAGIAQRRRFAAEREFAAARQLLFAANNEMDSHREEVSSLKAAVPTPLPQPLLTGDDLIHELKMKPGQHFAKILDDVLDAQLDGRIASTAEALELARQMGQFWQSSE